MEVSFNSLPQDKIDHKPKQQAKNDQYSIDDVSRLAIEPSIKFFHIKNPFYPVFLTEKLLPTGMLPYWRAEVKCRKVKINYN